MDVKNILGILWMLTVLIVSPLLVSFIIRYTHNKPPLNITLVDLIYCDLLQWMFLANFMYLSGIFVCHISPR